MTLVLEIEHLLGLSFAARSQASSEPDWPPQPDRVFSALVAAWGARGERGEERRALEWLEAQPVPEIAASGGAARTAATAFVPPNDPETGRVGDRSVLPALRRRQPRRFPAFRPYDPVVRLVWRDLVADDVTVAALNALAGDTPYVGHSASLTRCRFRIDEAPAHAMPATRRVYRGRLSELERDFRAGRRPGAAGVVRATSVPSPRPPGGVFSDRWLVLEHVGGEMPDLRASAIVGKVLRQALMSGYRRTRGEDGIPSVVSGHAPDRSPLAATHLAIVPLAFVGAPFADGHVLGFALVPPDGGDLLDDPHFQDAVREVAPWSEERGRRELKLVADGIDLILTLSSESRLSSLDPAPYTAPARTWASCTPLILDRHLKASGNEAREHEIQEAIAAACRHAGLPEPLSVGIAGHRFAVLANKHSAIAGAPSAYPSGRAPSWTGWQLPKGLATRFLTHAVVQFDEPVRGPVLLGAGRYNGLGLFRALDDRREER